MAMTTRKKVTRGAIRTESQLSSILASLGLSQKPDFDDHRDIMDHRIHWAVRVLKYAGYPPAVHYDFDSYVCGPYSERLERELEMVDWPCVVNSRMIDDERIETAREAILNGDDFLLALSIALGVRERNQGITKSEVVEMVIYIRSCLGEAAGPACDFAEARIWSK
jgi:hypothetical protein